MHTRRGGRAYFPSSGRHCEEGSDKVTIRTVDTDLVVVSQCLSHIQWIAFGVGKYVRFLEAHEIATALGPSKCIFHNNLSYPRARSAIPCFIEHTVQLF